MRELMASLLHAISALSQMLINPLWFALLVCVGFAFFGDWDWRWAWYVGYALAGCVVAMFVTAYILGAFFGEAMRRY